MEDQLVYVLGVPVYFLGILSLLASGFYAIVWPKKLIESRPYTPAARRFLRWGNALCWLLLSLALFAWGSKNNLLAVFLATCGAACYLLFMIVVNGNTRRPSKRN